MVGVTENGQIAGVRKEGGGSLKSESINEMLQVCHTLLFINNNNSAVVHYTLSPITTFT